MSHLKLRLAFGLVLTLFPRSFALGEDVAGTPPVLPAAVLRFDVAEPAAKELGAAVPDMLIALLSQEPDLTFTERAELDKLLSEQELSLSGAVDTNTATKLGQLTGAKVLITGRIFVTQNELVALAKIIGTDTARVYGEMASVPAQGSGSALAQTLADKIRQTLTAKRSTIVAPDAPAPDVLSSLKEKLTGKKLPTLTISITEQSARRPTIDPAAETTLAKLMQELGFRILDPKSSTEVPEVESTGEALSDIGLRKGNLVSAKGRVELKLVERASGRVLNTNQHTAVAFDLSEAIAEITALENAARSVALKVMPALGR